MKWHAVKWHLTIAAAIEPGRPLTQFRSMSMRSEEDKKKAEQTVKMHRHRSKFRALLSARWANHRVRLRFHWPLRNNLAGGSAYVIDMVAN